MAFVSAGALCVVGLVVWPGCATPSIITSRKPLTPFKPAAFQTETAMHPSLVEVVGKMGTPDEYFPDLQVVCYKLNQTSSRTLWLFLGIVPFALTKDADRSDVAMIQFDEQGKAQRIKIETVSIYPGALHYEAYRWIKVPAQNLQPH